ncbi:DUF6933 domain-containing protein [Paenisporosarcina sp. TG-14]|uniref:DUF6933 domain-containing protein n=1 Tax=Paenisporosarcina sp. TG-14 TaxID=1231057 RepID=UPI000364C8AB|nr:hypothetical protein [Paenisporosarcina sp. TG-14]
MLSIQCTKKLGDYLKKDLQEKPHADQDLFYSWHSHLFVLNRKKYIVVMNSKTRYHFVLGPLLAKDLKGLDNMICVGIRENLAADGVTPNQIEQYMEHAEVLRYMKTSQRAIIGQMNEAILFINAWFENKGILDLFMLNRKLNKFVMLKLPLTYSGRTMVKEMDNQYS